MFFTVWFRYRAFGRDKVPDDGGALFLINHQSFVDPLLVGLPLNRPVSYLARDSLFRVPVIGWILRNTYVMPINRDAATTTSFREALRRVQHGFLVGVFPEGTRTRDGKMGPFKPGFVALLRRAGANAYPVGIAGAHEAYPPGRRFIKPTRICVVFGDPLTPAELEDLLERGREQELITLVRERIDACRQRAERLRHSHGNRQENYA